MTEPEITAFIKGELPKIVVFLLKVGADYSTAEDIAQAAFDRACEQWSAIRCPVAWLRVCALRCYYRTCAARRREIPSGLGYCEQQFGRRPAGPGMKPQDWGYRQQQGGGDSPEGHALASELSQRIPAAWRALSPTQRAVLALHMDGLDTDVIAETLKISKTAVSTHKHDGRRRLKQILTGDKDGA